MAGRRVNKKTKRKKKRIGTMDLILLLVFICLVIFTVTMIRAVPGLRLGAGYPCNLCVCHTGRGVRYPGLDKDQQG